MTLPTNTPSNPSTSRIASRFFMASAVSIMAKAFTYLLASDGPASRMRALVGPQDRSPCGGYLVGISVGGLDWLTGNIPALVHQALRLLRIVDHRRDDATGSGVQCAGDESSGVVTDPHDGETVRELLQPLDTLKRRPLVQQAVLLVNQDGAKTQLGVLLSD